MKTTLLALGIVLAVNVLPNPKASAQEDDTSCVNGCTCQDELCIHEAGT